MSNVIRKTPEGLEFYIDGNLQFDSRDERVYHETLCIPALSLLRSRGKTEIQVLICGGGDGLALRECLRFPGVVSVDLVDISDEVVACGRNEFAHLNDRAFEDSRVTTVIGDAWEWESDRPYDLAICDFTFPQTADDARLFSVEWFARIQSKLTHGGVIVTNSVSPQNTGEAFWCIVNSVKAAGLSALPLRVCVPSFRALGYGAWGFILASADKLTIEGMRQLEVPVETKQADLAKLWRGASFSREERAAADLIPVNTLEHPALLNLLLNPKRTNVRPQDMELPDLEPLLMSIPIGHPYHTRSMIATLAAQVVGTVKSIDIKRLVDEIWQRAKALPERLRFEIGNLREFLKNNLSVGASWGEWSAKLFATLIIVLTLANTLAPDNAFAKGAAGMGHASFSRGGSFGSAGSFGHGGGFGHAGSFSHAGGFGDHFAAEPGSVSGTGFRSGTLSSTRGAIDIHGYHYAPRIFRYYDYGYDYYPGTYWGGYGYGRPPMPARNAPAKEPANHQPLFVADDDMMVMDNGDVVVTLSDQAFLLAKKGTLTLVSNTDGPLMPLYAEPNLFGQIWNELQTQKATADVETKERQDWLSWVGWTSAMFNSVQQDKLEVTNLQALSTKLTSAISGLGQGSNVGATAPKDATELFVGCYALPYSNIGMFGMDGKMMTIGSDGVVDPSGKAHPLPKALKAGLQSVLMKLDRELDADLRSYDSDLASLAKDKSSTLNDLNQYQAIYEQQGDPTYEVDYGTDSIGVRDAISRTNRDLTSIESETQQTTMDRDKAIADLNRVRATLAALATWSTT